MNIHIKNIDIESMWGDTSLKWHGLDKNVNIIVGQNGFGKTTMMNLIRAVLQKDVQFIRQLKAKIHVYTTEGKVCFDGEELVQEPEYGGYESADCFQYLTIFDILSPQKTEQLVKMKAEVAKCKDRDRLLEVVNKFFNYTGKDISIDDCGEMHVKRGVIDIPFVCLSAGEKQLLFLLMALFLMGNKPTVLMLDEPEISLHIEWQDKLIERMLELNPNCQIILTTHSPNIFADGWEDKLVFISDLVV